MGEKYRELMVKKEMGAKEHAIRLVCLLLTVFVGMLTIMTGNFITLAAAAVLATLTYFVFLWTDIEYEYLYLDKEIIVDKVMSKARRKRTAVIDVTKIEIMAPEDSAQLVHYKNRKVNVSDFSAGHYLPDQKLYAVYYEGNRKFLMNLDDEFADMVRMIVPKRVFKE